MFELRHGVFAYKDALRMKRLGTERLVAVLTLRDGRVVYDLNGLAFPEWKDAGRYERISDR